MKSYLLLRNNQKSGPFNYEEIVAKGLKTHDLIWIEGESKDWKYPLEIETLKRYVIQPKTLVSSFYSSGNFNPPQRINNISVSFPIKNNTAKAALRFKNNQYSPSDSPELTTRFTQSLDSLRLKYQEYSDHKIKMARKRTFFANASYLLLIVVVLAAGIFLVNKIIKEFSENSLATEEYNKQSAKIFSLPESIVEEVADPTYQNALVTEIIPASDIHHQTNNEIPKGFGANLPLIGVSYNHFTVQKKGGINNLEIMIFNNGSSIVDEITIEIDYLNKSGKTIFSEEFYSSKIKPNTFKTISIPPSTLGNDINCRIKKVSSKGYETTLQKT